jgi:outer membrane protein assembly factor BamB
MRTLVLLFLAACGGSATNPCAAPITLQWGTASDDEALAMVPARWENWFAAELSAADLRQTWWVPARTAYGDVASAVAVDADGGVFVAGANQGGQQPGIWARKLDAQGQQIWGSRLTPSGADFAAALAFASDRSLLLAGTRMAGGSQPVVFALDPATGAPRWSASVPRDLNGSGLSDVVVDAAGNIFVAGSTVTSVAPGFTHQGGLDPFALRFDAEGKLTGSWQGGSAADEEATAIALDSCGRILVSGWTDGAVAGVESLGRRDAFLLSVQLQAE